MSYELRWYEWQDEEYIQPTGPIQYGRKNEKGLVTKRKLQYRVFQNTAIYAGMPDQDFINKTATMKWSEWKDVPTVVGDDLSCP
jgi:hypothetical protein